MSMYMDHEFESTTLTGVLEEAQRVAREMWYRRIEWEVEISFRDLVRADVKSGRSTPADWPTFSPSFFVEYPYDTINPQVSELWERRVVEAVLRPSTVIGITAKLKP